MSGSRDVVVEAFARHRVVLAEDDPIITLGTILELAIDRGSELQAERIETANKDLLGLLTDVNTSVGEAVKEIAATSKSVALTSEAQEKEKAAIRKELGDELRVAAKHFTKEAKIGVQKTMEAEFASATYRIDEHVKRALSVAGGDHRWKDRGIGLLAGWSMIVVLWICYMGYLHLVKR